MDVLCVFGRPIEKVNGRWALSAYFERLSETGAHTGVRSPDIDPNADDPRIVVAGAEANATASALFFEKLRRKGDAPKMVVFSAGRPPYLRNDPDPTLNEARFFKKMFLRYADPHSSTKLVLQTQNINSYGDVFETLRLARAKKLESVGFVTVTVHMARCKEFYRHVLRREPSLGSVETEWFASETLLLELSPAAYDHLWEAMISKAYARTAERERRGIAALRAGMYDFDAPGYAHTPGQLDLKK